MPDRASLGQIFAIGMRDVIGKDPLLLAFVRNRPAKTSFVSDVRGGIGMLAEGFIDKKDREQVDAYVFRLLRQIGREPRRAALARAASASMGERLKTFLHFETASLHRRQQR